MKHACNQQGHSSTNSFKPNSSITGKLDLFRSPFWLCTGQPTRTERSISSTLTRAGLQSHNTIHDKLSPNSSWTGANTFSLFSFFFSPLHALVPNQKALPQLRWGDDWNVSGYDINVTRRKKILNENQGIALSGLWCFNMKASSHKCGLCFEMKRAAHLKSSSLTCSL